MSERRSFRTVSSEAGTSSVDDFDFRDNALDGLQENALCVYDTPLAIRVL
jgi:hypothetical protein